MVKKTADFQGTLLLGVHRSGTTLLRRLLDAHPAICCPGETNVFTACGRLIREEKIAEEVPVGLLSGLAFAGLPPEQTLRRVRTFAFGLLDEICQQQQKQQWVSKTPDDLFYLDEIEKLCADQCKFICLIRHPLDVICSIRDLCEKNGVYLPEVHRYICQHPAPLEAFAHLWSDANRRMHSFAQRHSQTTLCLRYEDLVDQPNIQLARVHAFLGVQADAQSSDADHSIATEAIDDSSIGLGDWKTYQRDTIDSSSVGRWKHQLSPSTVSRLAAILGDLPEELGYEKLPSRSLRDGEEARRRYSLGLMLQASQAKSTHAVAEA